MELLSSFAAQPLHYARHLNPPISPACYGMSEQVVHVCQWMTDTRATYGVNQKSMRKISVGKGTREVLIASGDNSTLMNDALRLLSLIHRQRTYLASEAHTHLGQKLTAFSIELYFCAKNLTGRSSCPPEVRESLAKMGGWVEELAQFSKSLVAQLTPNVLMQVGFDAAAAWAIRMSNKKTGGKTEFVPAGRYLNLQPVFAAYAFDLFADTLLDLEQSSVTEVSLTTGKSLPSILARFGVRKLAPEYQPAPEVRCRTMLIGGTIHRLRNKGLSWIELEMPVRDLEPS